MNIENAPQYGDAIFITRPSPEYICNICQQSFRKPVQTFCGHRFCCSCIETSLRKFASVCPVCYSPISQEELFPDVALSREMGNLDVKCPNLGYDCHWNGKLADLKDHLERCQFFPDRTVHH